MTRVELFEIIRRDINLNQMSIRATARKHRVHRRLVRLAMKSAIPPERKPAERKSTVFTSEYKAAVDRWLKEDQDAPRKQRHTSRRIFIRLIQELGYRGSESSVRRYVGRRRRELGRRTDVFVPQSYLPGREAEVDWFEAMVKFPDGLKRVQFFEMRSCYSGRVFVAAFPRQTQQAFLEAHMLAFRWFGGVFHVIRYDNLKAAVTKVLRGRRRVETDRFVAMRSHYLFESVFCKPGVQGAHEKGGVEGGCGYFRRNHLVPVPEFESYDALNAFLREACAHDDVRVPVGKQRTIQEAWEEESAKLLTLPAPFDTAVVSTPRVNRKGCIRVAQNSYSVPVKLVGFKVEARLGARTLHILHRGKRVATHPRLQGRQEQRLMLDHYLDVLTMKPGALAGATALKQARERGEWPPVYDDLWREMSSKMSASDAAQQMISVLMLHRDYAPVQVHQAVATSVQMGCTTHDSIHLLVRQITREGEPISLLDDLGELNDHGVAPNEDMSAYDALGAVA